MSENNSHIYEPKVAIYKTTGQIVVLYPNPLSTQIEFQVGKMSFFYMACELGGISNFEIIGEL